MNTFVLTGCIADIDTTVEGEPLHPTLVALVDLGWDILRVILPVAVACESLSALAIQTKVEVHSTCVADTWLVANRVDFASTEPG